MAIEPNQPQKQENNPTFQENKVEFISDPAAEGKRAQEKLLFEITRRERAEKERDRLLVAEREQRLLAETLREVADALNTSLSHKEILQLILTQLGRMVDYDSASIMLVTGDTLDVIVRHGELEQVQTYKLHHIKELPHVQKVLDAQQPVIIADTDQDSHWAPLPGTAYIRSWLGVPLFSKDQILGLINLNKEESNYYNDRDAEFAASFANHAAIAIENAWLFEETRHRVKRLAALREIDMAITASLDLRVTLRVLLDQVILTLEVDAADVLLLNPLTQTLEYTARRGFHTGSLRKTSIRLGEGYAGRAALERRIISFPDLNEIRPEETAPSHLPVEAFSAYFAVPLVAKGQVKGVLEVFHRNPLDPDPEWREFLETLAGQAAIAIDNAVLFNDLQRSNTELVLAYDTTLEGWARALELRDKETIGHTQRVTNMTLLLAKAMKMTEAELVHLRRGALLHDIGKMGIPDSILLKPGPLTEEEWAIMRRHPLYAYEMLSPITYLRPALDIPYCHHERWDGSGYPRELVGDEIPIAARIFAVADVWDALRSDRPYRPAMSNKEALAYIIAHSETHFDPAIVKVFESNQDIWETQ
jgi:HD-GYP domain-containing protein (c-di-GMP phosphodiesterase class II)